MDEDDEKVKFNKTLKVCGIQISERPDEALVSRMLRNRDFHVGVSFEVSCV